MIILMRIMGYDLCDDQLSAMNHNSSLSHCINVSCVPNDQLTNYKDGVT